MRNRAMALGDFSSFLRSGGINRDAARSFGILLVFTIFAVWFIAIQLFIAGCVFNAQATSVSCPAGLSCGAVHAIFPVYCREQGGLPHPQGTSFDLSHRIRTRSCCPGVTSLHSLLPLGTLMVSAAEVTYSSGCKDRRKHYGSRASARKK